MKRFILTVLAVIGTLSLIVTAGLVAALVYTARSGGAPPLSDHMVLELNLESGVVDWVPNDPVARASLSGSLVLPEVVDALVRAADDDRVLGVVARIGGGGIGYASAEEVRAAIMRFRESGKPAFAWSETFGEFAPGHKGYFLATAFDEIHLQPSGDVGLAGVILESAFYRGTLDKLDVEAQMGQRMEYKNAMNVYTDKRYTDAHREATTAIANGLNDRMIEEIAAAREMEIDRVREICDTGPHLGPEAARLGLVDHLSYRDEVYDAIEQRLGDDVEYFSLAGYFDAAGSAFAQGSTVALITGSGGVSRGASGYNPFTGDFTMGSDSITEAFREAVDSDRVKAIVFRVNSPGGSYVASDAIWREVGRARDAGKPVVVAMGDYAASGGYFVAMGADRIVAQPTTLTGSIGVLGGKLITRGAYGKAGLSFDAVETGPNASFWSPNHPYSGEERRRFDAWLDRVYEDFTGKVAEGRELPRERVLELARGRVWTGEEAYEAGLVDELGGLLTAIDAARELAGLDEDAPIRLRSYPARRSFWQMVGERQRNLDAQGLGLDPSLRMLEATRPMIRALDRAGVLGAQPQVLSTPVDYR